MAGQHTVCELSFLFSLLLFLVITFFGLSEKRKDQGRAKGEIKTVAIVVTYILCVTIIYCAGCLLGQGGFADRAWPWAS